MRIALHNLGCKVNSYEFDIMLQRFQDEGYQIVGFDEEADIYLVNTCSVTNIADRKSRQMLHRAKNKNPDAVVVAVGCYVQTDEGRLKDDLSVDLAVGNNRKKDIYQKILLELLNKLAEEFKEGVDEGVENWKDGIDFIKTIFNDILQSFEAAKAEKPCTPIYSSSIFFSHILDPLILDLDGDGYNVENKENGTNFDLDKNGFAEKINWTTKDGFSTKLNVKPS